MVLHAEENPHGNTTWTWVTWARGQDVAGGRADTAAAHGPRQVHTSMSFYGDMPLRQLKCVRRRVACASTGSVPTDKLGAKARTFMTATRSAFTQLFPRKGSKEAGCENGPTELEELLEPSPEPSPSVEIDFMDVDSNALMEALNALTREQPPQA